MKLNLEAQFERGIANIMKYLFFIFIILSQKVIYSQEQLPISIWYGKHQLVDSGRILSDHIKLSDGFIDSTSKSVIVPGIKQGDSVMSICYKGYSFQFNYKTFCKQVKITIMPAQYKNIFHRIKSVLSKKRPFFSVHYGNCSEAIVMITYPKERNKCR